jgi:ketopantoate reductase
MIKIGILGMGALGQALWVHLRAAGLRPVILTRRPHRFPPGTRLRASGVVVSPPITAEDLYAGEDLDVLFVTWNVQDNDQVSRCIDPRAVRWVVSLQNGLTKNTSLSAFFPAGALLRGCTFIEERAEALGPLEELVASFTFCGLRLKLVAQAAAYENTRLGLYLAFAPLCILTMTSQERLWTNRPLAEQAVLTLREFDELIGATGGELTSDPEWGLEMEELRCAPIDEAVESLVAHGRRSVPPTDLSPALSASVHQHWLRTRLETRVILESVLELARNHRHPVPQLRAAYDAVCATVSSPWSLLPPG